MKGRDFTSEKYRYGFNGKEKDDEVKGASNSYDFSARIYDNRLGRWLSLDPLAMKYPSLSPYNFVDNCPIKFIDLNGKEIVINEPPGSKAYIRIENTLKVIEKTNPKLYQAVHGSPIKVYVSETTIDPKVKIDQSPQPSGKTLRMTKTTTTEIAGNTNPIFAVSTRVKGITNIEYDENKQPRDAQLKAQFSSEEIEKFDEQNTNNPNAEPGWMQQRAYTDEEANAQGLVKVNEIKITIDPAAANDVQSYTKTVRHELGHAKFVLLNPVKAWIWKIGNLGKDPKGHETNNPNEKAAKESETPEEKPDEK